MNRYVFPGRPALVLMRAIAFATLLVVTGVANATAQERRLLRVEEDWMALIEETNSEASCPQILNVISPSDSLSGCYGMVEINHSTYPSFSNGGLQVQARRGESLTSASSVAGGLTLFRDSDRLEYTVALSLEDDDTWVSISNIKSKSWGLLRNSTVRTKLSERSLSLNRYNPDISADNSSVNVGANRVATMCLKQVRYVYSNGDVVTDETIRFAERYRNSNSTIDLSSFSNDSGESPDSDSDDSGPGSGSSDSGSDD